MVLLTCVRTYLKSVRCDKAKKTIGLAGKSHVKKSGVKEFIDNLKIKVIGGDGGNGCPTSKAVGGTGGDVIFEASNEADDLSIVKSKFSDSVIKGGNGSDGRSTRLIGPDGDHITVKVPCGITVFNEFLSPIKDLVRDGDKTIVAHGGQGGSPINNFFGTKGQSQMVTLDLRYYADLGLIGYPDSGKSLLFTKLTSPSDQKLIGPSERSFKRKRPHLKYIEYGDGRKISCVDLPSLIEGAERMEKGGYHYLKHLYHNQLILFVLDVNGFNRGIYRKPVETLLLLNKQIELFDDRYLTKPSLIIMNKMDSPGADVAFEEFLVDLRKVYTQSISPSSSDQCDLEKSIFPRKLINYQDIIPISCLKDRNVVYLKQRLRDLLDFNYLKSRQPDSPKSFVSLLEKVDRTRATDIELL